MKDLWAMSASAVYYFHPPPVGQDQVIGPMLPARLWGGSRSVLRQTGNRCQPATFSASGLHLILSAAVSHALP